MGQHIVRVVAAVIHRQGEVLIGQRRSTDTQPLKWEFPGGKVEPREPHRVALWRELHEELGIEAQIGRLIARYEHAYPKQKIIRLRFYEVGRFEGELRPKAFEAIVWAPFERLPDYDFLEGDRDFVRFLAREGALPARPFLGRSSTPGKPAWYSC